MVANHIPGVDIALAAHGIRRERRVHFLGEDAVAHGLGGVDLGDGAGDARLEIADAAEHVRSRASRDRGGLLGDLHRGGGLGEVERHGNYPLSETSWI